jgi:hypothetical protein
MGKLGMLKALGKSKEQRAQEAIARSKLVENLPEPSQNILNKMVELKLARIENNKYEYSLQFRTAFQNMLEHPPSIVEQLSIANKLNNELIPLVIARGEALFKQGSRAYENIVEAYAGFLEFCEFYSVSVDSIDVPNIIYGLYYLNDHAPDVQNESA